MKKIMLSIFFLVAVIGAFAFNAQAATIYGYTSFSGTFQSDDPSLDLAMVFTNVSNVVISTERGTYDYASIPGGVSVDITSAFIFDPAVDTEMPDFWVVDFDGIKYIYTLQPSGIDFEGSNQLNLSETSITSISGFDDTDSIWFLSSTGTRENSTFTLSTLVPPDHQAPSAIPEPTTMILFGIGLLGFAGLLRPFLRKLHLTH